MTMLTTIILPIFSLLFVTLESVHGHGRNDLTLVLMVPILKRKNSTRNVKDISGVKRLAAAIMAMNHINNKTDGFYDSLVIPRLNYIFYDSKRTTDRSWWNTAQFSSIYHENKIEETYAIVGPASSSPSLHVNRALQDGQINVFQIGYSASSPTLSSAPLYARTIPNDKLKVEIIYDLTKQEDVFFPCLIHGDDDYSNALAAIYKTYYCKDHECVNRGLRVSNFATGKTDKKELLDDIFYKLLPGKKTYREIFKVCSAIIIFAQNVDGEHILEHIIANKQEEENIRVYGTETLTNTLFKLRNREDAKSLVLEARSIEVATPYTTRLYKKLQKAWHNQIKNCSLHDDRDNSCLLGKKKYPFIANDGTTFISKCIAFNFSDHKMDDKGLEVSGEGYIDASVPFTYDSIIAIAYALNVSNPNQVGNASRSFNSQLLYDRVLNSSFEGFSGTIKFTKLGDRAPDSVKWHVFSFSSEGNKVNVNVNSCSRDPKTGSYKISFKSPSTTYTAYRPVCSENDYNFSATCSDTSLFINELITKRKKCICRTDECLNCCVKNDKEFQDKLYSDDNKPLFYCPYIPSGSPEGVIVYCLAIFTICVNGATIIVSFIHRNSKSLKTSQVELLILMLFGSILVSSFTIVGNGILEKWTCTLGMWFFHLGTVMILVPMLVRTWRIHMIFNNKTLKRSLGVSVNMKVLWPKIILCICLFTVFLLFRTFATLEATAAWKHEITKETILTYTTIDSYRCSLGSPTDMMLFTIYFVVATESLYYTYQIKGVSLKYQDSAYVGAFWLSAFIFIFFVAIVNFTTMKRVQKDLILRIGINVQLLVLSGLLLLPKLLKITKNIDSSQQHSGKTKGEILSAKNMELEHDNQMNNRTIIELSQEIESLKSQLSSTRPRTLSSHVYERVFKTTNSSNKMTENPIKSIKNSDGTVIKFNVRSSQI